MKNMVTLKIIKELEKTGEQIVSADQNVMNFYIVFGLYKILMFEQNRFFSFSL